MAKSNWFFTLEFDECGARPGATATGIRTQSARELEEIAEAAGFDLTTCYESPTIGAVRQLRVQEPEDSLRLQRLIKEIKLRYNLVPAGSMPTQGKRQEKFFGVRKVRSYSKQELDHCELLYLHCGTCSIAKHQDAETEELMTETYVSVPGSTKKKVRFGNLSPFRALVVRGDLKSSLESESLTGLRFEPVVNGENIFKLTSSIVLPRCKLPLVGGNGLVIEDVDNWSDEIGWRLFRDHGYDPAELVFGRTEIESIGEFDIAITRERTGVSDKRAVRWCIVSQKFRRVLTTLKVVEAQYAPVRIQV